MEIHRGDIRQPETLNAPMRSVEAVVHLAGMIGVWRPIRDYQAVNVTGTENVCRAALIQGARVVHVSSWTVYGMGLGQPAREDFPLVPFDEPSAITKAAGDALVQRMTVEHRLPAVIIRPATFFGPGDLLHFARIADRLLARRAVIVGAGANALPLVYVTDVVQGVVRALYHHEAVGQAYNISNDHPLTQQQFLEAIAREVGAPLPRLHVPYVPLYVAGYAAERLATITRSRRQPVVTRVGVKLFGTDNRHAIDKARRQLGYSPRETLQNGVRLTAAWYRAHRQLDPSSAQAVNGGPRRGLEPRSFRS